MKPRFTVEGTGTNIFIFGITSELKYILYMGSILYKHTGGTIVCVMSLACCLTPKRQVYAFHFYRTAKRLMTKWGGKKKKKINKLEILCKKTASFPLLKSYVFYPTRMKWKKMHKGKASW